MAAVETGAADVGVWLQIAELARRKGVSKQAVAKRVNKLVEEGKLTVRSDGRKRLVELATYDRIVGQVGDGFKEQAAATVRESREPTTGAEPDPQQSGLRDAQTLRAKYEANLKALDFAERTGQVVPLKGEHGIEGALIKVSDQVVRHLGQPMQWVDEIMEASRKGEPQLRRLLRSKVAELRRAIAEDLIKLSGEAAQAEAEGIQIDIHFEGDDG
jgi:hypothetical protein